MSAIGNINLDRSSLPNPKNTIRLKANEETKKADDPMGLPKRIQG